ncbi:hypothetical protein FB451DRAFT_1439609 [Mycena latifolia]|nr:hypothetical protein FB451DRAFT_1439609 [Mycena latifolia]
MHPTARSTLGPSLACVDHLRRASHTLEPERQSRPTQRAGATDLISTISPSPRSNLNHLLKLQSNPHLSRTQMPMPVRSNRGVTVHKAIDCAFRQRLRSQSSLARSPSVTAQPPLARPPPPRPARPRSRSRFFLSSPLISISISILYLIDSAP